MSSAAYRQGQYAALIKLGFATPERALGAHALAGAALGGTVGALQSDEHPVRDALIGGTLGGTLSAGAKAALNKHRLSKMTAYRAAEVDAIARLKQHANSLTEALQSIHATRPGEDPRDYAYFSNRSVQKLINSPEVQGNPPSPHTPEERALILENIKNIIKDRDEAADAGYAALKSTDKLENKRRGWF